MSLEIIFLIILLLGMAGMIFIIFRKLPVLSALSEKELAPVSVREMVSDLGNSKKALSLEMALQKILAKVRILILKSDNKTFNWLQSLRKKTQKNKFGEDDTYWKDVRNMTKK
ncbi:MAG: hypothetical protein WC302_03170 [Candidatus Paceibacterota bacterium]|jgi:hypothetical protein